jgi:hypothetical protein
MPLSLTDEQKSKITQWVADGASLADVQKRLAAEFAVSMTYMDTRFLLDDLNLTVKEKPQPTPAADLSKAGAAPAAHPSASPLGEPDAPSGPGGKVKVWVDKIVRPGAALSGGVTFSDGQSAEWYMDQTGRLGLIPKTKGYQPKQTDVQEFQIALQDEMTRMGY